MGHREQNRASPRPGGPPASGGHLSFSAEPVPVYACCPGVTVNSTPLTPRVPQRGGEIICLSYLQSGGERLICKHLTHYCSSHNEPDVQRGPAWPVGRPPPLPAPALGVPSSTCFLLLSHSPEPSLPHSCPHRAQNLLSVQEDERPSPPEPLWSRLGGAASPLSPSPGIVFGENFHLPMAT